MSDSLKEQLKRGERAEKHVQSLLAIERSLILEAERYRTALQFIATNAIKGGGCLSEVARQALRAVD